MSGSEGFSLAIKSPGEQESEHVARVRRQVEHWWPRWHADLVRSANRARERRSSFIMMPWEMPSRSYSLVLEELELEMVRLHADLEIGHPCAEAEAVMAERFAKELRASGWEHARVSFRERVFGGWERVIELSPAPNRRERNRFYFWFAAGILTAFVLKLLW
jgi:hypothetical protein